MAGGAPGLAAPPAPDHLRSSAFGLVAAAIVLAGIVLRLLAARGELWLDELWSLRLIDEIGSVATSGNTEELRQRIHLVARRYSLEAAKDAPRVTSESGVVMP